MSNSIMEILHIPEVYSYILQISDTAGKLYNFSYFNFWWFDIGIYFVKKIFNQCLFCCQALVHKCPIFAPFHPPIQPCLWPCRVTLISSKLGEERRAVCRWQFNLKRRMSASEGGKGENNLPPLQTLGSFPLSAPRTHPPPTRTPSLESHQGTRTTSPCSLRSQPQTALPTP